MDAVTGKLSASAVSAANGSIRLLLHGHEMALKHGGREYAVKFLGKD